MTDYKTMRVPVEAWEAAREAKREGETWGQYLRRCSDHPPELREFVDADGLTVTIDATERERIAKDVAKRLRG